MTLTEFIEQSRTQVAELQALVESNHAEALRAFESECAARESEPLDVDADGYIISGLDPEFDDFKYRSAREHFALVLAYCENLLDDFSHGEITGPPSFGIRSTTPTFIKKISDFDHEFSESLFEILSQTSRHIRLKFIDCPSKITWDFAVNNPELEHVSIHDTWLDLGVLYSKNLPVACLKSKQFYRLSCSRIEDGEADKTTPEDEAQHLTEALTSERVILIEWVNGLVWYKSNRSPVVNFFDTEETRLSIESDGFSEEDFIAALSDPAAFHLGLLYKSMMAGHLSSTVRLEDLTEDEDSEAKQPVHAHRDAFSFSLQSVTDPQQEYDGWRIVDYAARYGDALVIRELTRHPAYDPKATNSEGATAIEIALEHGPDQPEVLFYLLGLHPDTEPTTDLVHTLSGTSSAGMTWLGLAVRANKPKTLKCLINYGVDVTTPISVGGITPFATALGLPDGRQCADLLLAAGAEWPAGTSTERFDADSWQATLAKAVATQTDMIRSKDLATISTWVERGDLRKSWLSLDNQSAPGIAFSIGAFDVYAYLRAQGFAPRRSTHDRLSIDTLSEEELKAFQQAITEHLSDIDSAHILFLLSKTRILQKDPRYFERMRRTYHELDRIPLMRLILQVLASAHSPLMIMMDFEDDNVAEISAFPGSSAAGSAVHSTGHTHVAGKVPHAQMRGTLAHELTHQAMQCLFANQCNPYKGAATPPELLEAMAEAKSAEDSVLSRVFTVYKEADWPAEIIVRVPHILALYGAEGGAEKLRAQAPKLFAWYQAVIEPACHEAIDTRTKETDGTIALDLPEQELLMTKPGSESLFGTWQNAAIFGACCVAAIGAAAATAYYLRQNHKDSDAASWRSMLGL